MARIEGQQYALYVVAGGTPASPTLPASYTKVGQRNGLTITGSSQEIVIRDADGASTRFGSNQNSSEVTVNYDPTVDAGVAILEAAYDADPKTEIGFLIASTTSDEQYFYGEAVVGNFSISLPADQAATASFTLGIQGDLTKGLNA